MTKVRLVNLFRKFGNNVAVDNVSLEVGSGDFVVILGPSGCGKTTTLRCIAGLETPDSGDIYIGDRRANELPPKDRDVAMVFQNYALYPHMTSFDNISFPLRMRKTPKIEIPPRVGEVSQMLNIKHLTSREPRQLSGGEQQRVALSRALVRHPQVFLMDEPLSNLDAKLRLYTRAEIKRLHEEIWATTIYVTHDQAEAMSMADKIAVMNHGKVSQYEDPITIYDKPSNTFVASFMGSPPMNLVQTSVVQQNSAAKPITTLVADGFRYQLPESIGDLVRTHLQDGQALLGVRPENLLLSQAKNEYSVIEAEVYVVEPLGASTVVDLKVGSDILKAVTEGSFRSSSGKKIWVGFSPDRIHIFDAKSGDLIV